MEDEVDAQDHPKATEVVEFEVARFSSEWDLPPGDRGQLADAAAAVRQEFRDSSRWKRLSCKKVSVFAERARGTVFVIHVGKAVEFDWTWEGAKAFCPRSLGDDGRSIDRCPEDVAYEDDVVWSGEVVEVDEPHGCLFVVLDDPEATPKAGGFFVRPFEFLSVLDAIYNAGEFADVREKLSDRLNAAEGGVHPVVSPPSTVGLDRLRHWWQYAWSVLWGPPGTGKTWTAGQQIARVLTDRGERVLVVSTTNRATDALALSLGEAAKGVCPHELAGETLSRIGKGASWQSYASRQIESMLAGTEAEILAKIDDLAQQLPLFHSWEEKALTRKQIGELKATGNDRTDRIFLDPETRVVIATAFKATRFLKHGTVRKMVENGESPFTTIIIDEAGLISRTAVAALSLLAARRVVLVGDSKQLAPISRIARALPTRQQTWLASSGLSHLEEAGDVPPAVHLLSEQHRMHPDVCDVVSSYQYGGMLKTANERANQPSTLSPVLADASRAIWYVLDEENADLAAIRARRGPGNRSWVRLVTRRVLEKLFSDRDVRQANGLFISPFKAQANAVREWLAGWGVSSWEASTVHSQQGAEADIVVFDTVNAGSHTWSVADWKRLINVGISRAREAVIVVASRGEMDEPYLRHLRRRLSPMVMADHRGAIRWRKVGQAVSAEPPRVAEQRMAYFQGERPDDGRKSGANSSCRIGDQFAARRAMKPLFSQEQQRLMNLELDGKPRLIRGIAGSGKSVVLCNWLAKTAMRLCGKRDTRIWAVYANQALRKMLCESIESAWDGLQEGELFGRAEFPWEHVELLHIKEVLSAMLPMAGLSMEPFGFDYDRAAEALLHRRDAQRLAPRCSALFIDEAQDMGPSTLKLLLSVVEQSDATDANSRSAHIFYDNAQNVYGTKTPKWAEFGLDMRGRSTIMRESFRSTRAITEFAVNVLDRLVRTGGRDDLEELRSLGLLKPTRRNGEDWLEVRFSQVDGPKPIYHGYRRRSDEISALAAHLTHLIEADGISPNDICVIYNGRASRILRSRLAPSLAELGVELSFQTKQSFERKSNTLIATTPHSYKGYESEVVVIPCVDHFVAPAGKILAHGLYVAMSRARSLLAIYGLSSGSEPSRHIGATIAACSKTQRAVSTIGREDL